MHRVVYVQYFSFETEREPQYTHTHTHRVYMCVPAPVNEPAAGVFVTHRARLVSRAKKFPPL